jgi:hypothetical protein
MKSSYHITIIRPHYIQVKMVNNTTLAMLALIAALGLVTLVVEPIIPQAFAPPPNNNFDNRLKACDHSPNPPFCHP